MNWPTASIILGAMALCAFFIWLVFKMTADLSAQLRERADKGQNEVCGCLHVPPWMLRQAAEEIDSLRKRFDEEEARAAKWMQRHDQLGSTVDSLTRRLEAAEKVCSCLELEYLCDGRSLSEQTPFLVFKATENLIYNHGVWRSNREGGK